MLEYLGKIIGTAIDAVSIIVYIIVAIIMIGMLFSDAFGDRRY